VLTFRSIRLPRFPLRAGLLDASRFHGTRTLGAGLLFLHARAFRPGLLGPGLIGPRLLAADRHRLGLLHARLLDLARLLRRAHRFHAQRLVNPPGLIGPRLIGTRLLAAKRYGPGLLDGRLLDAWLLHRASILNARLFHARLLDARRFRTRRSHRRRHGTSRHLPVTLSARLIIAPQRFRRTPIERTTGVPLQRFPPRPKRRRRRRRRAVRGR